MTPGRSAGFTLLELLVVVVIVALLLVLALPSYQSYARDMRRALAGAALLEATIRQEQFFLDHKRYARRLTELGYPAHPYAIDHQGSVVPDHEQGGAYRIELATVEGAFTLTATPLSSQAADRLCGTLSLDSAGIRRVSGQRPARECW